jgi:hypothetical protein
VLIAIDSAAGAATDIVKARCFTLSTGVSAGAGDVASTTPSDGTPSQWPCPKKTRPKKVFKIEFSASRQA